MHELAVTQSIVDACCERANGTRVLRVTLEVGSLCCVMPDSLRFCYDVATEDTPLEGSELEIIVIPAQSRCHRCGDEVALTDILGACRCGSVDLEPPRGGDGLRIRSMETERQPSALLEAS